MLKAFIYSTVTGPLRFVDYDIPANPNEVAKVKRHVIIQGGANLPKKGSLETPAAVMTEVSGDDLAFLMSNDSFQDMLKKGFMRVEQHKFDPEVVANDMVPKDGCAPKTENDFVTGEVEGADVRAIKVG